MDQHLGTEETRVGLASDARSGALHDALFDGLDASIATLWAQARQRRFWRRVSERGCSRELYRVTMLQIFHYTRHNSINQALTAFRADPEQLSLLRFVYEHAREELGHEKLVLHDLKAVGLLGDEERIGPPLPATDALINYLYGVALREGPVPRLGYSYWAESVYAQIAPLLGRVRESLALSERELTFFSAHSAIDERHAQQVRSALRRAVSTPEQASAVQRVASTTLWLTLELLDQAFDAAHAAAAGGSSV
jgi:pyrroloquinoline quinone (PQQ) biosynthesis protein C